MNRAEQWKAAATVVAKAEAAPLELPSGVIILARRPGPSFFAEHQRLPFGLATKAEGDVGAGIADASDRDIADYMLFLRELLVYSVVEPRISDQPGPDEISPKEIPDADLRFIVSWAIRGPEAVRLESFRSRSSDASAGNDSKDVRLQTKRTAGDRGSRAGARRGSGGLSSVSPVKA